MKVQPFSYLEQKVQEAPEPTPGIVTTNLKHNYDSNDPLSYPGTGNVITDLQGNTNMSIFGTTAYGTYGGITNVFNIPQSSNSYIGMTAANPTSGLDITIGFSMEMWVNLPAASSQDWFYSLYNILNFGSSSSRQMFRFERTLGAQSAGSSGCNAYDRYSTNADTVTPSLFMSLDTWHHCVMTYTPGSFKWYLNSVDAGSTNFTAPTTHFDTNKNLWLMLSRRDDKTSNNYGMIAGEWRLYEMVLSPTEVTQNWNATKTRYGY